MIVITTPTGQIGRQVLDRVLDSGEAVRVIARDPSRLPARVRSHAEAEVVQGSHGDAGVITKALAGADRLFWLVPPPPFSHPGSAERYYLDFTRPACEAIRGLGVGVVGVSTLGHGYQGTAGLLSAALAMDKLIEGTGADYRALALPFFMENLLRQAQAIKEQGTFSMANTAGLPLPAVATRDVAAAAAALLLRHFLERPGQRPRGLPGQPDPRRHGRGHLRHPGPHGPLPPGPGRRPPGRDAAPRREPGDGAGHGRHDRGAEQRNLRRRAPRPGLRHRHQFPPVVPGHPQASRPGLTRHLRGEPDRTHAA